MAYRICCRSRYFDDRRDGCYIFQNRSLEDIRADVYQLILKAEHIYEESGSGKQKMKWVVSQARKLLPQWAQALISEETLMNIIQIWFDGVKDLLDDGKMNDSSK